MATNYRLPISLDLPNIHQAELDTAHTVKDDRHPMEGAEDSVGMAENSYREIQVKGPWEGRKEN